MPWKEWTPMDERLKFNARLLDGDKDAPGSDIMGPDRCQR